MAIAESYAPSSPTTQVILLLWSALFTLPFFVSLFYMPTPYWFVALSVTMITLFLWLMLSIRKQLPRTIPPASYWMISLFAIWLVQPLCTHIAFPSLNICAALIFLSMALLAYVSSGLQRLTTAEELITCLAWALVTGALIQAAIGILQATGIASQLHGWVTYDSAHKTTIFGTIAQRNRYAHYLSWGLLAVGYLAACHKMKSWIAIALAVLLTSLTAWNGSRTVVLYLIAMAAVALLWHGRLKDIQSRRISIWLCAIAVLGIATQWLPSLLDQWFTQPESGLGRIIGAEAAGIGRRQTEWHKAWIVFQQHPWFGCGWEQYGWQSLLLHLRPEFKIADFSSSLFTNAHNILLHLLAEMGLMGTCAAVIGFLWTIRTYLTQPAHHTSILPIGMMAMTLLHSMVEFPLWHMGFLGVFVVMVSLAPSSPVLAKMAPAETFLSKHIIPLLSGVVATLLLGVILTQSSTRKTLVDIYVPLKDSRQNLQRLQYLEVLFNQSVLMDFFALKTINQYLVVNRASIGLKLHYINQITQVQPFPDTLFKKARLEALAGRNKEAEYTMQLLLTSFPTLSKRLLQAMPKSEPAYCTLRQMTQAQYNHLPLHYK